MKIRAIIAALLAAIVLVGCGSNGDPDLATDDHLHIDPLDPQHMEADQLATLAMGVILSWKPAEDASTTDALRRAKRWIDGPLLDAATVMTTAPTLRPDRRWEAWRSSGDSITATCERADSTPNAPAGMRTLVIDVTCRQTVLHRSGAMTPLMPETWRTTVTLTDDGWRMTDYSFHREGK